MKVSSSHDFKDDLLMSAKWASVALILCAVALVYVSDLHLEAEERLRTLRYAILLLGIAGVTWQLETKQPLTGRWFMAVATIALLYLGIGWLQMPALWLLIALPSTLAMAMLGLRAAAFSAIVESLLLWWLWRAGAAGTWTADWMGIGFVAIWSTFGVVFYLQRRSDETLRWSLDHSQQARRQIEENRHASAGLKEIQADLLVANRTLALLNERLAAMRLVAEEAEKTKAAFVAKISHEFRTPLNMIIGLIDSLANAPEAYGQRLPTALLNDLDIVRRNGEHLTSMINDVLALSQAEAGQMILHREWVDLREDIEKSVTVVRPLLDKKQLVLQMAVSEGLPPVYCDRTRIRQVILNLISNAARFTDAGGITVRAAATGSEVVISVADTGPGIVAEDVERIFEPFQQSTGGLWRDRGGSGLGLSISKQFIELHHGQIWVESEVGMGSTFSFRLPISAPLSVGGSPQPRMSEDWVFRQRSQWSKTPHLPNLPRLLLCDESGFVHTLLKQYSDIIDFVDLNSLGQVVEELQRCPAHAVICNATSPNQLSALLAQARALIPDTPLLGCYLPPPIDRALAAGAVDFLIKPITQTDLQEALQTFGKAVQRVLIVDDDPDVCLLYSRMLQQCDKSLEVTTATNGAQGLQQLRQMRPDLVLLDLVMPEVNGWQLLELKNRDEAIQAIPVIIISAEDLVAQTIRSDVLLASTGQGISINQLLHSALWFSRLVFEPARELDPMFE